MEHHDTDLEGLLTWWQTRQAALAQAKDGSRQTARQTFHVEARWLAAIRRQADLTGDTYTQIVNEAFRQYFHPPVEEKYTSGPQQVDIPAAPGPGGAGPAASPAVAARRARVLAAVPSQGTAGMTVRALADQLALPYLQVKNDLHALRTAQRVQLLGEGQGRGYVRLEAERPAPRQA